MLKLHVTEYLPMICSSAVLRCLGGVVLGSLGVISWSSVCSVYCSNPVPWWCSKCLDIAFRRFGVVSRGNINCGVILSLGTAVAVVVSERTRLIYFTFSIFSKN
jgi:hypothetical protein